MLDFADLASDLEVSADHLRGLECLDRTLWTAHQRYQVRRLAERVQRLIGDLTVLYQKTGLREPSFEEIDAYR